MCLFSVLMAVPAKMLVCIMIIVYPLLVPSFAMLFPIFGVDFMWKVEHWIYRLHDGSRFPHLFQHLDTVNRQLWNTTYGLHALGAGLCLLAIYWQMWKVFRIGSRTWKQLSLSSHVICGLVYLACSTMMAWKGAQLVPGMYANDLGKLWTFRQALIILFLNTVIAVTGLLLCCSPLKNIVCSKASSSWTFKQHPVKKSSCIMLKAVKVLHISSGIVSAVFLFFVGVVERFLVQFVYPVLPNSIMGVGEEEYKMIYSLHFPACAVFGIAFGIWLSCVFYMKQSGGRAWTDPCEDGQGETSGMWNFAQTRKSCFAGGSLRLSQGALNNSSTGYDMTSAPTLLVRRSSSLKLITCGSMKSCDL